MNHNPPFWLHPDFVPLSLVTAWRGERPHRFGTMLSFSSSFVNLGFLGWAWLEGLMFIGGEENPNTLRTIYMQSWISMRTWLNCLAHCWCSFYRTITEGRKCFASAVTSSGFCFLTQNRNVFEIRCLCAPHWWVIIIIWATDQASIKLWSPKTPSPPSLWTKPFLVLPQYSFLDYGGQVHCENFQRTLKCLRYVELWFLCVSRMLTLASPNKRHRTHWLVPRPAFRSKLLFGHTFWTRVMSTCRFRSFPLKYLSCSCSTYSYYWRRKRV